MRSLLLLLFVLTGLSYGASTESKIKASKKDLSAVAYAKKKASRRLDKIVKDIKTAEKEIDTLEKKIDELDKDKYEREKEYERLKVEFKKSKKELILTNKELEEKREAFIKLLSEQFSIVYAIEQAHEPTRESIISQEVYRAYKEHNAKVLASLRFEINILKQRKIDKLALRDQTEKKIKAIEKKRDMLAEKKVKKEKLLKILSKDESKYNSRLSKIEDRQNSLRSTLAKLNILHAQEVEEARKRAIARKEAMRLEKERKERIRKERALARKKAKEAEDALKRAKTKKDREKARLAAKKANEEVEEVKKRAYKESEKVRQINSSYKKSSTYAYRGGKTISPIRGARLIKKFGTYIDPIYKIKIFNESITLQAPSSGAKVQNVLNGKVVFAGNSSMLGKVVVVAHSGKIHTVYAGLAKIAPNIKPGRKIKKGYVVGKVDSKLMFQATKNSKHINPLRLIQI